MTVDQAVAKNRRAHVHRDVGIFPDLGSLPLAGRFGQRECVSSLACAGDDELSAGPEWRGNVLMPFVRKGQGPKLFAGFSVETDNGAFRHSYDLLSAGEFDQHGRSIAWSSSAPLPFGRTGSGIECKHLPAMNVAADLDHETAVNE